MEDGDASPRTSPALKCSTTDLVCYEERMRADKGEYYSNCRCRPHSFTSKFVESGC